MSIYRLFLNIMIINSFISLTNRFYPTSLPLGKIIGFVQIIMIMIIYLKTLKRADLFFLLYLVIFDFMAILMLYEPSIDIENIIFFTSTCALLWKFSEPQVRLKLKIEVNLMQKNLYRAATFLLFIGTIGLIFDGCWKMVNGQKVYFAFCESGHKLSGNMCFVAMLYLLYFLDKKFKIVHLIYFLLPFFIISLTGSRTYLVSYLVVLIVLYIKKLRNYNLKLLLMPILLCMLVYFLFNSTIINRFFLMGANQYISDNFWEATSSGRLIWWKIDIKTFLEFDLINKLFGKGFSFLYNLNLMLYGLKISAHNDFITLLVSLGLFGLSGYSIILFRWLFKKDLNGNCTLIAVILSGGMYLWNAMINGVFGAQQYIFANILLGVILLEDSFGNTVRRKNGI